MRVSPAPTQPTTIGRAAWSSLRDAPLITLPLSNPIQRAVDGHLHKLGIARNDEASLAVSFLATQISMVEAGFGHAVVPTVAAAACRRHQVKMDVLTGPQLKLGFYRVARRGAAETQAMQAFDAVFAQHLPSMSR